MSQFFVPFKRPSGVDIWLQESECVLVGCRGERLHFHFSLSSIGEGNGNPLQCSCLENLKDRGAWWAAVYGVAQSRTGLKWLSSSSRGEWQGVKVSFFLMWTIFKVFMGFVTTLLLFFNVSVFWLQGMWYLSSITWDQIRTPGIRRSLNHQTIWEVPRKWMFWLNLSFILKFIRDKTKQWDVLIFVLE